ncbi:MAG: FKBP-type peptidyl-prolyl cis-trans isomerase [Elusimicrobiales bacterium]|nr:FKBP-type peptidyl-prolyl cis-trans isomerase [Elusimicrobiales bacterium]
MKKIIVLCIFCFMVQNINIFAQQKNAQEFTSPYMLGLALTRNISEYDFTAKEIQEIVKGFSDGLNKKIDYKTNINYDKLNEMMKLKREALTEKNKKKGTEYLKKLAAENKGKIIENGIVYVTRQNGTGNSPTETDTVKVHYRGSFIDGTEFDSSYKRNEPAEFQLNSVIPCWTKALSKMKVGEKATIGCPSDTAYGDNGIERVIPPGSTLIFDVELLDIVKKQESQFSQQQNQTK